MTARMNGAGIVVRQLPQAGASIERETIATLWLARLRVEATAGHEQQLAVAP
jgi:hypothetical protein